MKCYECDSGQVGYIAKIDRAGSMDIYYHSEFPQSEYVGGWLTKYREYMTRFTISQATALLLQWTESMPLGRQALLCEQQPD